MYKTISMVWIMAMAMFILGCSQNEANNQNAGENTGNEQQTVQPESKAVNHYNNNAEPASAATGNDEAINAFSYLKKLDIDNDVFIKYNEANTTVFNKKRSELPTSDPFYAAADMEAYDTKLLQTKVGNQEYVVVFTWGPSADAEFMFFKSNDASRALFSIPALYLYVPGTNFVYAAGHTNNLFNMRQKFQVVNDKLTEVKQPFYYVGLISRTKHAVTLYDSKSMNKSIAQLPENYSVEVLIYDTDSRLFLIKTDFGLTGWLKLEGDMRGNETIEGIYFAGD